MLNKLEPLQISLYIIRTVTYILTIAIGPFVFNLFIYLLLIKSFIIFTMLSKIYKTESEKINKIRKCKNI